MTKTIAAIIFAAVSFNAFAVELQDLTPANRAFITEISKGLEITPEEALQNFEANVKEAQEDSGYAGPKGPAGRGIDYEEAIAVQKFVGTKADGKWGPATEQKVIEWKRANGISHNFISEYLIDQAMTAH